MALLGLQARCRTLAEVGVLPVSFLQSTLSLIPTAYPPSANLIPKSSSAFTDVFECANRGRRLIRHLYDRMNAPQCLSWQQATRNRT